MVGHQEKRTIYVLQLNMSPNKVKMLQRIVGDGVWIVSYRTVYTSAESGLHLHIICKNKNKIQSKRNGHILYQ